MPISWDALVSALAAVVSAASAGVAFYAYRRARAARDAWRILYEDRQRR